MADVTPPASQTQNQYNAFLTALAQRESANNPGSINYANFIGLYQIGEAALVDLGYIKNDGRNNNNINDYQWTAKSGVNSTTDFLQHPEIQTKAITEYHQLIWQRLQGKNDDVRPYLGQTIDGVVITKSGLIAAAHLVGVGGVRNWLFKGVETQDGLGTKPIEYLKKFAGYNIDDSIRDIIFLKPDGVKTRYTIEEYRNGATIDDETPTNSSSSPANTPATPSTPIKIPTTEPAPSKATEPPTLTPTSVKTPVTPELPLITPTSVKTPVTAEPQTTTASTSNTPFGINPKITIPVWTPKDLPFNNPLKNILINKPTAIPQPTSNPQKNTFPFDAQKMAEMIAKSLKITTPLPQPTEHNTPSFPSSIPKNTMPLSVQDLADVVAKSLKNLQSIAPPPKSIPLPNLSDILSKHGSLDDTLGHAPTTPSSSHAPSAPTINFSEIALQLKLLPIDNHTPTTHF